MPDLAELVGTTFFLPFEERLAYGRKGGQHQPVGGLRVFGMGVPAVAEGGIAETNRRRHRPMIPLAGISGIAEGKISRRRTGWLGREYSNLEMVDWNLS